MRPEKVSRKTTNLGRLILLPLALLASNAFAQNPVPFVNQPLLPSAVAPGGPSFTLTVNGTGFVSGATVNWNGTPLTTTFVSGSQLTAAVPAANIALMGTASVAVVNAAPGGGTSNVVFLPIPGGPSSAVSLQSPVSYSKTASGIVVADFNGDGILDIASSACGTCSPEVVVLLGRGDGSFGPATSYVVLSASGPQGIVAGDFNGDGKIDLAVADHATRQVSVLLGNGDGTFQPHVDFPASPNPWALVVGDFTGDGKLDLAVTSYVASTVSILLGNGDGTFQAPVSYPVNTPEGIATGDFNGDGKLDLVTANSGDNTVSVLLGNGDGTFQSHVDYSAGVFPVSVVAADLNGDGRLDLAVAGSNSVSSGAVLVLLGNGDGTFQAAVPYALGGSPASIIVGDFTGNGKLDLVTCIRQQWGLSIVLGNGDGTFQTHADYPEVWTEPYSLAAGDFNGDGMLDIAATDEFYKGINVLLQIPPVGLTPLNPSFRDQALGTTSPPVQFALTNNSGAALSITSIAISGADSGDFAETNDCPISPATLAAGASCTINVTFSPTALGSQSAVLSVTESAPGSLQNTTVSGTGINPGASLSATSLSFASQNVATTSPPQTVTLANTGVGPLTISGIAPTGDFAETGNCGTSLAQGANCTVTITFTPTSAGTRTGTVIITDNAANSPQTISLMGTGALATITLSTTSLTFGNQSVSTTSAAQPVIVTNSGTGPLVINSVTTSGDFAQTNNCPLAPNTIAAGANCTITITFTPTALGTRTGAITFTDNAANSPQTVSLTGTGALATITLSTTSLTFASQGVSTTSAAQPVIVTNSGTGLLVINSVTTSGDFAQTNNCPIAPNTIAAGANCTISVTFTPTAGGTRAGFLTITDNAAGSPQTVTLSGTGAPPTATASPSTLGFGNIAVGTTTTAQAVTLSNSGPGPLAVSGIAVTGANSADFPQTNNCPSSLAASASCTINVTFKPSLNSAESGTLTINDNAASNPQTVSLSGTGQAPVASLSPGSLDFPGQTVGVTSAPEAVTLANSGSLPLTVSNISVTSPFVVQSSTCPGPSSALAAGASCTINLTFTPGFAGTTFGSLLVSDNSLGSAAQSASLTGEATVNFGNQPVGQTSGAQTVTVANGSTTTTVTVTGATATGDFAVASNSCGALPPGGSCAPTVTFTPTAPGTRTGALMVGISTGSALSVPLTGTGLGATATLSKSSVAFGSQLVGTTSSATAVTVTNNGNQALNFTTIAASGDFSMAASGTTCAVSTAVAAGTNCTINVTFTPTTGGARTGAVTITDNASDSPQTIALSGTGQDFTMAPPSGSSTSATVAPGQPATYTLSLGGEGGLSGAVTFTCTGAPSEATCTVSPNPVTAGSSATNVTVTVTTTAPSVSAPRSRPLPPVPPLSPGLRGLLMLALVLAALAWAIRRRNQPGVGRWRSTLVPLASALLLTLALAGCGGGGGGGGTTHNAGTPAGTYTLTVTGTTGSGSATLTHTVTLTLTVS